MKNYVSEGKTVSFIAPSGGAVSGKLLIVGALALVPAFSAAEGEVCEGLTCGVFTLPKTLANAPAQFQKAYWNASTSTVTTDSDDGGDPFPVVGVFMDALEASTASAAVRLNGVAL